MHHLFSRNEADALIRASEGHATAYKSGMPGHAAGTHLLLTTEDMKSRFWAALHRERSAEFLVITAFASSADIARAAQAVLNSAHAQAAMDTLFRGKGAENGMRATIEYSGAEAFTTRYVASSGYFVRTMPTNCFVLVLDRNDDRPFRLHVQTFFGAVPFTPRNVATVLNRNGSPVTRHSGPG